MGTTRKQIVISGYYGFGNSGDEAVLLSILLALEDEGRKSNVQIEPVVLSIHPEDTAKTYGVRAVHRLKIPQIVHALSQSDGLISGGGSLLQDVTGLASIPYYLGIIRLAQWFGKPTFIYSQGVGPVQRKFFRPWIRGAFNRSPYVSVRDEVSASWLAGIGVKSERIRTVPDPVMGMPRRSSATAKKAVGQAPLAIGVSVRYWNEDRSELAQLAEALVGIQRETGAEIRFLPFHHPADIEASQYVIDKMNLANKPSTVLIVDDVVHPQDMLAEVADCRLLIGMRLHSLIYAATQYVPMVGISYDPKVNHFLQQLGMEPATDTSSFSIDDVVAATLQLWDRQEQWKKDQYDRIEQLRANARQPATKIIEILQGR